MGKPLKLCKHNTRSRSVFLSVPMQPHPPCACFHRFLVIYMQGRSLADNRRDTKYFQDGACQKLHVGRVKGRQTYGPTKVGVALPWGT